MADPDETGQITLTQHGSVRLVPRERASPTDRGTVPFDVFQGGPSRLLALLAPATVDNEERAFLTEAAISAVKERLDERLQQE